VPEIPDPMFNDTKLKNQIKEAAKNGTVFFKQIEEGRFMWVTNCYFAAKISAVLCPRTIKEIVSYCDRPFMNRLPKEGRIHSRTVKEQKSAVFDDLVKNAGDIEFVPTGFYHKTTITIDKRKKERLLKFYLAKDANIYTALNTDFIGVLRDESSLRIRGKGSNEPLLFEHDDSEEKFVCIGARVSMDKLDSFRNDVKRIYKALNSIKTVKSA